jgi:SSS family solute:Na+ symporter
MAEGAFIPAWIALGYYTLILFKGISCARHIRHVDDYLIGGRTLGAPVLLCTTAATLIGGGASVGAIGKAYEWGVLLVWVSAGWYLQLVFSGWFVAPKFRALHVYTTAGFVGHFFGRPMQRLAAVLSLVFSLGILSAQLVAFGKVVQALFPVFSYEVFLLLGAMSVLAYNWAGGFLAVVRTDVYQFILLLFGFGLTAGVCAWEIPWGRIEVPESFWKPQGEQGWLFAAGTFIAFTFGEMFAPGYATRFCAGRTPREVQKGIAGAGMVMLLVFVPMLFLISLYARHFLPGTDPQTVLPTTLLALHNPWISGVILAAVMAAVMSSADSILNSATAIVLKDFMEPDGDPEKVPADSALPLARRICLVFGTAATLLAWVVPDIIGLLLWSYSLWAPAMVVPCCMAAFPRLKMVRNPSAPLVIAVGAMAATLMYRVLAPGAVVDATAFGLGIAVALYGVLRIWSMKQ